MHIQRDVDKVLCNRVTNDVALLIRRVLEKLLTEVVAERIFTSRQRREANSAEITYQSSAP